MRRPRRPPLPSAAFNRVILEKAIVPAGARFGRIYEARHLDPIGFGKGPSRFSDPRRLVARNRFGVLYLGSSLKVCFVEAILRDDRDGAVGDHEIGNASLGRYRYAEIEVIDALTLVDLRADGPIRKGIPSDVAGASAQSLARAWSAACHDHPDAPDGIVYASRLNEETNLAIYGRAVPKLKSVRVQPLVSASGFADVLNTLRVALI
ncbi:MAG: RES domain-containing protein [Acetobacteraceae bacterium]|nr:RES domain-containing protein [Acetobacteraceae bacterium]